jgi:hypothetical protein
MFVRPCELAEEPQDDDPRTGRRGADRARHADSSRTELRHGMASDAT